METDPAAVRAQLPTEFKGSSDVEIVLTSRTARLVARGVFLLEEVLDRWPIDLRGW